VAWCYHHGEGVASDRAESEAWFRRAFERGSQRGLLESGRNQVYRGDYDAAEAIFGVGTANGWAPAEGWLALARLRKPRTRATLKAVRPILDSAVAKGDPRAKVLLGACLARGWFGLRGIPSGIRLLWSFIEESRDVLKAIEAAKSGEASAQYRLGWLYAFGGPIAHNDAKAMELFNLSAAQGEPSAMMAKGWMYAYARAVNQDILQAYVWSAAAAVLLPETDVAGLDVAVQIRDWAKPLLSKADVAKARRMIRKLAPGRGWGGRQTGRDEIYGSVRPADQLLAPLPDAAALWERRG